MSKKLIFLVFPLIFLIGFLITVIINYPKNPPIIQAIQKSLPTLRFVKNKFPIFSETTIILTGDIMLGRSVMETSLSKNNPNYPFEKVSEKLRGSDIVFANLENPIVKDCPYSSKGLKFCADPKMLGGVMSSGIDIVNIANNHIDNYGETGSIETKKYLSESGIDFVGDKNLVIKTINGTRFGFLGFDFLDKIPQESDYSLMRDSKKKVDVLIVMTHWGVEYTPEPTQNQKVIAKKIIDAGTDILVGGHPHWVQSIEYIDGKPVFYSLGNFIFDQPWSEETKKGLVIKLTYLNGKIVKTEKLPIYMKSIAQPEWQLETEN